MTRCVTNARAHVVVGNLLPFFVPMSLACSITVSFVGQTSTLVPDVSSTSHWSRKVPIARVRSTSAGIKEPPSSRPALEKERKGCMWYSVSEDNRSAEEISAFFCSHPSSQYMHLLSAAKTLQKPLVFHQNPTSQAY